MDVKERLQTIVRSLTKEIRALSNTITGLWNVNFILDKRLILRHKKDLIKTFINNYLCSKNVKIDSEDFKKEI